MTAVPLVPAADSERDQGRAVDVLGIGGESARSASASASAKRPKSLHPVAGLPRSSTGEVRRLDLPGVLGLASG